MLHAAVECPFVPAFRARQLPRYPIPERKEPLRPHGRIRRPRGLDGRGGIDCILDLHHPSGRAAAVVFIPRVVVPAIVRVAGSGKGIDERIRTRVVVIVECIIVVRRGVFDAIATAGIVKPRICSSTDSVNSAILFDLVLNPLLEWVHLHFHS